MKTKILTPFVLLMGLTITACGNQKGPNVKFVDIVNAQTLFVGKKGQKATKNGLAPLQARRDESTEPDVLYKITNNGEVMEVTVKDANGNESKEYKVPRLIQDMTERFVLTQFDNYYIVDKTNGSAYALPNGVAPILNSYSGSSSPVARQRYFQQDDAGNVYFALSSNGNKDNTIVKMNVSKLPDITLETVSGNGDWTNQICFGVLGDGTIIYNGLDSQQHDVTRIVLPDHRMLNLNPNEVGQCGYWRSYNGELMTAYQGYITKIEFERDETSNQIESAKLVKTDIQSPSSTSSSQSYLYLNDGLYYFEDNMIYQLDRKSTAPVFASPIVLSNYGYSTIRGVTTEGNYLYAYGLNATNKCQITKINPNLDYRTEDFSLETGAMDISKLVATPTGLNFSALNMNTNVYVVGTIDSELQNINHGEYTFPEDAKVLQRIC